MLLMNQFINCLKIHKIWPFFSLHHCSSLRAAYRCWNNKYPRVDCSATSFVIGKSFWFLSITSFRLLFSSPPVILTWNPPISFGWLIFLTQPPNAKSLACRLRAENFFSSWHVPLCSPAACKYKNDVAPWLLFCFQQKKTSGEQKMSSHKISTIYITIAAGAGVIFQNVLPVIYIIHVITNGRWFVWKPRSYVLDLSLAKREPDIA